MHFENSLNLLSKQYNLSKKFKLPYKITVTIKLSHPNSQ